MDRIKPVYYKEHPSGVECIDIARHYCFSIGNAIKYLWRAGLKKEIGIHDTAKEIEDLNKAIWYIQDRIKQLKEIQKQSVDDIADGVSDLLLDPTSHKEPCVEDSNFWDNTVRDYAHKEYKRLKKIQQEYDEKETKEDDR